MSAKIKLQYPFKHEGGEFKELNMRRPKVIDLETARAAAASDMAKQEKVLFANLCEVAPEVISELDLLDYDQLAAAYSGFLSPPESASTSTT